MVIMGKVALTICFLFSFFCNSTENFVPQFTFSSEIISDMEYEQILSNLDLQFYTTNAIEDSIKCFDVNQDGTFALGFSSFEKKTIQVYSQTGDFQYGYSFSSTGSFGIEWEENLLRIYLIRSDLVLFVNDQGECLDIRSYDVSTNNNNYYLRHVVFSNTKETKQGTYNIQNTAGFMDFFLDSSGQLTLVDHQGTEHILYDVSEMQKARLIFYFISILILIVAVLWTLRRFFYKKTQETGT